MKNVCQLKLACLIILLTLSSCATQLNIIDEINPNESFVLKHGRLSVQNASETKLDTVKVGSTKHEKLLAWFAINQSGWRGSMASYVSKFSISQKDFTLNILNNGVVINFHDQDKKPRQYTKAIDTAELKFLSD